ncbi:MAG: Flp pilus assembly protein CpaB [Pseudomonadota bacterium]
MGRKAPFIFIALAIILAAAAAWGSHRYMTSQALRNAPAKAATAPVVVAAADLGAGQRLESGDLRLQHWPLAALPPGHLAKVEAVTGRVLKGPLVKGEVLLAAKLAPEGLAGGLSAVVPAGYRAMTVRVDEVIGVGGFVQPGDRVDVLVTVDKGPFRENPGSRVVLQDVPVLTVGEKVQEETSGSKPRRHKVTVVTLQVLPAQGERLALAASEGKVVLALRNQGDRDDQSTRGVTLTALMPAPAAAAAPAPPVPPAAQSAAPAVEVIKGVNRSRQTLGENRQPGGTQIALAAQGAPAEPVEPPPCAKKLAPSR